MASDKKDKFKFSNTDTALAIYVHFLYKNFGRSLLANKKFKVFFTKNIYNSRYEKILKKANLKLMPEEYFVSIYLSIVIVLILILFSTIFLYFFNPVYSIFSFYGGVVLVSALGVFLYNYPVLLSKQRGDEIDASIPYLLPYMKILAKELNISKIIDIIDDFLIYKEIQTEFKRIKYYLNFLGYDIHSSIREAMQSCPSKQLSDLMNDLVTISNSGGDIYRYLDRKLGNLNDEIEAIEKKNLDTLLIYSQIYVVLLLISPLFFTIMTSILDLISASASTTTTALTGTVMTIIGLLIALPFAYIAFMMLIFYSKPLYSRLKPLVQK